MIRSLLVVARNCKALLRISFTNIEFIFCMFSINFLSLSHFIVFNLATIAIILGSYSHPRVDFQTKTQ